ncbi:vesicle-trafficking protein SEC22c isoform X4 [Electrophorus electricus]|uniref:vesicle-trafficking protein SEC22c isoform X4 n=1 Tax=Electrophorus electricus TaxID=8005 RepID=UPI0015D0745C|nr:vesicle-trafficking protein SEC22c isoform X4 [Electrophorus electricus]
MLKIHHNIFPSISPVSYKKELNRESMRDGLPLTASTDFQHSKELQERKQQLKVFSKSLNTFPERGTIKGHELHIHFFLSEGVAYWTVCACSLPSAIAFCFLEDLRWEFTASFDNSVVTLATRPYPFLEFDSVIQKLQQQYNQSGGPSLGVTLAEVQEELKLNPPQVLTMEDVQLTNGSANGHAKLAAASGQSQRLEPVSAPGILSLVLNIMCAALNLIRGVHLIEYTFQDDYDGLWNVMAFLLAFVCCICQERLAAGLPRVRGLPLHTTLPSAQAAREVPGLRRVSLPQSNFWNRRKIL